MPHVCYTNRWRMYAASPRRSARFHELVEAVETSSPRIFTEWSRYPSNYRNILITVLPTRLILSGKKINLTIVIGSIIYLYFAWVQSDDRKMILTSCTLFAIWYCTMYPIVILYRVRVPQGGNVYSNADIVFWFPHRLYFSTRLDVRPFDHVKPTS